MNIYESDLEDMLIGIIEKNDLSALRDRGLDLPEMKYWYRQLQVLKGVADIVGLKIHNGFCHVLIIELKKDAISHSTLDQAKGYAIAIKDTLKYKYKIPSSKLYIQMMLIGRSISDNVAYMIDESSDELLCYTYNFDALTGISFNIHSYIGRTESFYEKSPYGYANLDIDSSELSLLNNYKDEEE